MTKTIIWGLFAAVLVGVSGSFAVKVLHSRSAPPTLPVLGQLQDFSLIDQNGAPFTLKSLQGSPWIADFIYTHCPGQCLLLSQKMERIQALLPKESQLQLVSISVDPTRDTPTVLTLYAKHYNAQARWHFLTGSEPAVEQVMVKEFKLPFDGAMIHHSEKMVLVDGQGQIRGYYDALDEADLQRLMKDASREKEAL